MTIQIPDYVKRPPRGLAHDLLTRELKHGCPGFDGGRHTAECDRLTKAFIDYGRWRELKGKDNA